MMRKFTKVLLITATLTFTSSLFAQTSNIGGSTTCYIMKNDKLQTQDNCIYTGKSEFAGSGGTQTANFYMRGNKIPIKVRQSVIFESPDEGEYLLNGKSGVNFWRLKSNLKKANEQQKNKMLSEDNGIKNFISCILVKNTKQEFCYSAEAFGNF